MNWLWTSLAVAIFSTAAVGQQIKLEGRLISDDGKPVANIKVSIGDEQSRPTDKDGRFSIRLPPKSREGERVVLTMTTLLVINQPLDGDWAIPAVAPKGLLTLDVIVARWGSKGVWTDARIEKELKQKSSARFLEGLLERYGSTPDVTKAAFEKWAITQDEIGNKLKEQSTRAEGPEVVRLLGEAESAYRRALLVLTRDSTPQEWATTQHNLGYVLQERGVRANGSEAVRLIGEGVAAYRQGLSIRTREQLPLQWAMTQNDLGNALQAQGARTEGAEGRELLSESVTAYRQALLVFTREFMPQQWAMTQHNVGSVLQEQGARRGVPESTRLFGEAVTAYREALVIWTLAQRPQQWAMAQNNLARAHYNLKEWTTAAECYENVLEVYPEFRAAYDRARFVEHEVLFNYQRAFKLTESWLQRNPDDLLAAASFAENHFTTGSFDECGRRISSIMSDAKFGATIKIPLRALEIANLIALNRSAEIQPKIKNLIDAVETQKADFKVQWSFAGIKHFIESEQFASKKTWLLELFAAFDEENRDSIIKKLQAASANFKN